WEGVATRHPLDKETHQAATSASFQELRQWEDFFAYPGEPLLRTLGERIASGDATGSSLLAQSISTALLTHSYRTNLADWEPEEHASISLAERVPGSREEPQYRPYFEVLMVSPAHSTKWSDLAQELRGPALPSAGTTNRWLRLPSFQCVQWRYRRCSATWAFTLFFPFSSSCFLLQSSSLFRAAAERLAQSG